jgi:hypothetical protein
LDALLAGDGGGDLVAAERTASQGFFAVKETADPGTSRFAEIAFDPGA